MRTFRFYFDDMMRPLLNHESGYLVGRKPVIMSFERNQPTKTGRRKAISTRMGQRFVKRLQAEGW